MQGPGIKRPPAPVHALNLVRHDHVRVELRIGGTAVVMIEGHCDDAHDRHPGNPTVPDPGRRDPLLQHREGIAQRCVMRLHDQRLRSRVRNTPHGAERLRRRERQIEARNRSPRPLRHLLLTDALDGFLPLHASQRRIQPCNPRRNTFPRGLQPRIRRPEPLARHRMNALAEQPGQLFLRHRVALRQG